MAFLLSQDQMSALVEAALGHLARTHKGDMFPSRLYDAAFKFAINRHMPVANFSDITALNEQRKAIAEAVATEALRQYMAKPSIGTEEVEMIKEVTDREGRTKEIRITRIKVINHRRPKVSDVPTPHKGFDLPGIVVDTLNHLQSQEMAIDERIAKLVMAVLDSNAFAVKMNSDVMAGGGLKYGAQLRSLDQFMNEKHKGKAPIRLSWQYLSGRFYPMSPLHHMQGDPIRALFTLTEPKESTARGKRIATRFWSREFGVAEGNYLDIIQFFRDAMTEALLDKERGKPSFTSFFLDGLKKRGIALKKAIRTFAAALAMKDLAETGKTNYIFFPDATSDGMQRLAALTGDKTLGHFTNIQASKVSQSLYKVLGKMAMNRLRPEEQHLVVFFQNEQGELDKEMCKWPVMRLVYGSGKDSLAKGMLFANPEDAEEFINPTTEKQIPGALEERIKKEGAGFLNPTFVDAFVATGIENAVANARRVAKLYESALNSLSPKWKPFIMALREVFKKAVTSGQPMEWVLGKGATRVIETWELDDESPRRLVEITTALGKSHRISVKEVKPSTRASKAPPLIMHADDGFAVMNILSIYKKLGLFYLPLHDAHGVGIDGLCKIKAVWKKVFYKMYWKTNRLYDLIHKWGIKTTLFKNGPEFLDAELFRQSKHCLGC